MQWLTERGHCRQLVAHVRLERKATDIQTTIYMVLQAVRAEAVNATQLLTEVAEERITSGSVEYK